MSLLRLLEILGITLLIVGSIVVAIISVVWKLPVETILAMILGLLGALGLYELAANLKIEEKIGNLQPGQIPLSQQVTQAEWYNKLHETIISAKQEISITHHDPRIPTQTGAPARRQLWELLLTKMKEHNIMFRWIVAIGDVEKLNWVCSVLEENKDYDNLNVNYSSVDLDYPAPPQSIQIIDGTTLFAIDMSVGHYAISEVGSGMISRDTAIIEQFQRYYNKYWERTIELKEGPTIHYDRIKELREKLEGKKRQRSCL